MNIRKHMFLVFAVSALMFLWACFFMPLTTQEVIVCANTFSVNDVSNVCITLKYKGEKFVYNSCEHVPNITNFTQARTMHKNNRTASHEKRAQTIEQMVAHSIPIYDSFLYMFYDFKPFFENVVNKVNVTPKDATLTFTPNLLNCFNLTREVVGYKLNQNDVLNQIKNELYKTDNVVIELKPQVIMPKVFYKDLVLLTTKLSSFSTSYATSGEDRKHNIKLALENFNGLKILPHQTISFNSITGVRNSQKGYKEAHIILDSEYVDAVGGGVCQASTTLYNALLLAGVQINEVHSHSLPSSYVDLGFDAMVNFGTSDLVFTNPFQTPLFLKAYCTNQNVCVQVYGQDYSGDVKVKRISQIIATIPPPNDKIIIDDAGEFLQYVEYKDQSFYKKLPKSGFKVKAMLEYSHNGEVLKTEVLRTVSYKSQQGIKVFGAKNRPENVVDEKFLQTLGNILGN